MQPEKENGLRRNAESVFFYLVEVRGIEPLTF